MTDYTYPYPWVPVSPTVTPVYPTKMVKRITRTIQKYGPYGEYLGKEIITEDQEDVEVPDYNYPAQPFYDYYPAQPFYDYEYHEYPITISSDDCNTISNAEVSVSDTTFFDPNISFTYTQN